MKNPEKFRKNIDGVWYYKCNCCKQWKIETEFGCDNYCNARHGHTTRCKRCLHIINHYDKGYKVFHIPPFKMVNYIVLAVINIKILKNLGITKTQKIEMEKNIFVSTAKKKNA